MIDLLVLFVVVTPFALGLSVLLAWRDDWMSHYKVDFFYSIPVSGRVALRWAIFADWFQWQTERGRSKKALPQTWAGLLWWWHEGTDYQAEQAINEIEARFNAGLSDTWLWFLGWHGKSFEWRGYHMLDYHIFRETYDRIHRREAIQDARKELASLKYGTPRQKLNAIQQDDLENQSLFDAILNLSEQERNEDIREAAQARLNEDRA